MTRFVNGWAIPRTPNAQYNWGLLGDFRMPLSMPQSGNFSPNSEDILGEGLSTEQMTNLCIAHQVGIIPTTLIHDSGDSDGDGYHGEGGAGRGPYLSISAARKFGRQQAEWFKAKGANVIAFEFGNELEYSPRTVFDHEAYLDRVISQAMAFKSAVREVYPGIPVIIGGNHGRPSANGRKTLAQRLIERGLQSVFVLDIHGNGKSIQEVEEEIEWCRERGFTVVVLEDRNPGPNNDAFNRSKRFAQAGAIYVGQFADRNVNAGGDNPGCVWGTSTKRNRSTGAAWTCAGWLPDEYARLRQAAQWCGNGRPGSTLPDDTEGEPSDPPAGGTDPGPYTREAIAFRDLLDFYATGPRPVEWKAKFAELWPKIIGNN